MSKDLLKKLEEKINAAVETIELSRMEISELKEEKVELENRYNDWEERLTALIEKFEQLEEENLDSVQDLKNSSQQVEDDENGNLDLKDSNSEELAEGLDDGENDIVSDNGVNTTDSSDCEDKENDDEDNDESNELLSDDDSEEGLEEINQNEESVFGPSSDSYTEAPGSIQHYA